MKRKIALFYRSSELFNYILSCFSTTFWARNWLNAGAELDLGAGKGLKVVAALILEQFSLGKRVEFTNTKLDINVTILII